MKVAGKKPRAKALVKTQPLMKTLTKTIVKKKDAKLVNEVKGKKLKVTKKKKLKELGKKVAKGKNLTKEPSSEEVAEKDDKSVNESGVKEVNVTEKRILELNDKVATEKKIVKKPDTVKVAEKDNESVTELTVKKVKVIKKKKKKVKELNGNVLTGKKLVKKPNSEKVSKRDDTSVTESGLKFKIVKIKILKDPSKKLAGRPKLKVGKKTLKKPKVAKKVTKRDSELVSSGENMKENESTHVAPQTQESESVNVTPGEKRESSATLENNNKKKLGAKSKKRKRTPEAFKLKYDVFECNSHMKRFEERERALETDIFGDLTKDDDDDKSDSEDDALDFSKKPKAEAEKEKSLIPDDPHDIHGMVVSEPVKKAAWVDEDDDNIRVMDSVAMMNKAPGTRGSRETSTKKFEIELRETYTNVYGATPDWADLNSKPEDDLEEGGDIIRSTGNYLVARGSSVNLPKKTLEYKQMANLNTDSYSEGSCIEAIDFNPSLQFGLVAGKTFKNLGAATLFQVDGNNNHRIHSMRFPNYPVSCAAFLRDGKRFVVGSDECNHIYVCNMETMQETKLSLRIRKTEKSVRKSLYVSPDGEIFVHIGNRGKINIYDVETFSLVDELEAPFNITSAAFNSDGSRMYTHGMTGEVCIWDMDSRMCVHKFHDDGCIFGTTVAMSPNNQYLACGSKSGIVNIYDSTALSDFAPTPVKILTNLTTPISSLAFNSSSEILAMASDKKTNAMKLVHFPSMTVFENFPKLDKEFKNILSVRFSPNSGYFAAGNTGGVAHLFRLKHFATY